MTHKRPRHTLILRPKALCNSAQVQVEIPGCGLADPGPDRGETEAFMGSDPVTAVEPPELTLHLEEIDRLAQTLLGNRGHQRFHLGFIQGTLKRASHGGERDRCNPHKRTHNDYELFHCKAQLKSQHLIVLAMLSALRRLAAFCLCLALCFGLAACDGGANAKPATISPDDMAVIRRQVEGFTAAKERLPELAQLVNQRDWTFTRNLIHGPMQEVGREMLYINQRLLPQDRDQANALAADLKEAMADLDEAARLQDGARLQKAYVAVATGFSNYSEVIPAQALS